MAENRFFHISSTGKLRAAPGLPEALALLKEGGYLWIDFYQPTAEDLGALAEPLGLHPLAVEDCLDKDQIPKVDEYPQHTFILFNAYSYKDGKLHVEEVDFFLGKNYLVSVSGLGGGPERFFDKAELDSAIHSNMANAKKGPDHLLHIILDFTLDKKFAAIEALQEEIDEAEEIVLKNASTFKPAKLVRLRRQLLSLRKSLFHEREVLIKICRKDSQYIGEKAIYHFRDIYDHLAKFFETTEIYREMITSLMELYVSMINNQIAVVGNRTNHAVRRLTVINTIFMPLMFLTWFGMSEWSMITGPENWKWTYPLFIASMVVIGGINWALLKAFEDRTGRTTNRIARDVAEETHRPARTRR